MSEPTAPQQGPGTPKKRMKRRTKIIIGVVVTVFLLAGIGAMITEEEEQPAGDSAKTVKQTQASPSESAPDGGPLTAGEAAYLHDYRVASDRTRAAATSLAGLLTEWPDWTEDEEKTAYADLAAFTDIYDDWIDRRAPSERFEEAHKHLRYSLVLPGRAARSYELGFKEGDADMVKSGNGFMDGAAKDAQRAEEELEKLTKQYGD